MKKKKLFYASGLFFSFFLTSCQTEKISSSISEAVNNALPNIWVSLAQFGAFLVTVFIFFKFAYKPLKNKIKQRNDYVKKNIDDSNALLSSSNELKEESEMILKKAKVEANEIIEKATLQAQNEAEKIRQAAMYEVDKKMKDVQLLLKEKQEYLERKAHNEVVKNALDASKEILAREFTYQDNEKIVNDFLNRIEKRESVDDR